MKPLVLEQIIDLYTNQNKTLQQIADIFECSTTPIRKRLKEFGIDTSNGFGITKEDLIELYINQQKTCGEIAKIYNCWNTTISGCLKRYGIKTRDQVKDITGQRFGRLIAIKRQYGKGKTKNKWYCLCDCGKETETTQNSLSAGHTTSCGCYALELAQSKTRSKHRDWKGFGEISGSYWCGLKTGADLRNIVFDIKIEDAWELYLAQETKCRLTGWNLSLQDDLKNKNKTASLDRIDSSKNYTKDNIQWVHKDVNKSKWSYSNNDFIQYCHAVSSPNTSIIDTSNITEIYVSIHSSLLKGATTRNIEFQINREDMLKKFKKQNGLCSLSGIPLILPRNKKEFRNPQCFNASLDRIDSKKNYTIDNIQWVDKAINKMKRELDQDYFIKLCTDVANYNK